ncbi:MAG: 2-amino-4-hydroxy-6-hydroxymethyldihydropteridine diphosphokinase [Pseudomonadota bacterium]
MPHATHLYAIALGSNRPHGRHGRPAQVIAAAIARLDQQFGLFDASPILINPAQGGAGRDFANAVVLIEARLHPHELLSALKTIERDYGRRPGRRWGARVLDLDILAWSGGNVRSTRLTIPHPRLAIRAFAIGPLASIAPDWPIIGALTARHLASRLARRRPLG